MPKPRRWLWRRRPRRTRGPFGPSGATPPNGPPIPRTPQPPPAEPPRPGTPTMWLLDGPPAPGPDTDPAVQHWACPCGSKWDVTSPSTLFTFTVRCAQCGHTAEILPGPEPTPGR